MILDFIACIFIVILSCILCISNNYKCQCSHIILGLSVIVFYKLAKYFNCLVGLKHFSVRTKAIYHAFVEELELRNIDYDVMLFSKERMLSYYIDIVNNNNRLMVIRQG